MNEKPLSKTAGLYISDAVKLLQILSDHLLYFREQSDIRFSLFDHNQPQSLPIHLS